MTGVPTGCPVNNQIPDWNDLVYRGDWDERARNLHSTNNFPEFTGRVCPAPCEASCTLNINDKPVTIKTIECAIADRGDREGARARSCRRARPARSVAVVGSGPAGMACRAAARARRPRRARLSRSGPRPAGCCATASPTSRWRSIHVDRRVEQMQAEGVTFHYGVHVGATCRPTAARRSYDAVVLAGGAEKPRDLPIPGRELDGIHFAMEFLPQQNRRVAGEPQADVAPILATGKHVVVIGGGDTGSDCIGTSIRQGALSVTNFEIMPQPPEQENKLLAWPDWPLKLRTSSSHEEGVDARLRRADAEIHRRERAGQEAALRAWSTASSSRCPAASSTLEADLVLLAMGFVHPVHEGMLQSSSASRSTSAATSRPTPTRYRDLGAKVFAAGDMRRGQSLVVWAIREGRQCARAVDKFLMGSTTLPR